MNYTVTVQTSAGPAAANIKATLPSLPPAAPPTTTTTTVVAPTTTTVVAAAEPTTDTIAGTPASGSSSSGGPGRRLLLGASAEFIGLSILTLLAVPFKKSRSAPRNRLGVAYKARGPTSRIVSVKVTSAVERMLERRGRRRGSAHALEVAGISLRPGEFMVLAVAAGSVLAVVFFALFGVLGIVIGAIAAPLLVRAYVSSKANQRRRAFGDQLPTCCR